jgi:tetratricopeptide (TPR) repeat protein
MKKAVKKKAGQSGSKAAKTAILRSNVDQQHWWDHLDALLRNRQIAAGIDLLNEKEPQWNSLQSADRAASDVLLTLAQWVDVGYRDAQFLRRMLDLLPSEDRLKLGVGAYVRVRMAEAFHALAVDDVDGTIRTLDIVLRLDRELLDVYLKTVAHLWKGRAHRRNADYEIALEHIQAALALASTLPDSETISAILKVQQGWLVFQRGDVGGALHLFDEAEEVLQQTDHWIALGNIESARGRIIRRKGDYVKALHHFDRAVSFYERRQPHHPNLARAVTNRAFVKRLLALQLQKHIDSSVSRRVSTGQRKGLEGARLRPLHKQYQDLYRSAIEELERAKEICILHEHHSGLAATLLNAGHLHLDVGDLDLAEREAGEANAIAERLNSAVLKVRAHILIGLIENSHVEELLGNPEDVPSFARRAKQHCVNAVSLAQGTQNKRLLLNAHLALGEVATNNFFHDYDLARRCLDSASMLIEAEDADYVVDELNALRTKLLKTVGIDDTLRAWSQGIVTGKSLQEVMEEFAQLVVTQIWLREGRRISRVAKQLSMSPKKVRRLVKHDRSSNV